MSAILGKMDKFFQHSKPLVNTTSRVYNKVNQNDDATKSVFKRIVVGLKTTGALLASPFLAVAVMVDKVVQDVQFAVKQSKTAGSKGIIAKRLLLTLPLAIGMGLFYLPQGAIQQVRNAINVCKTKPECKTDVEQKPEETVESVVESNVKSGSDE